ncbi:hypothetical protein HDV00_001397 [Rhizophlyctis rosea]|nr:hypothetical protein HDV00_001397 [Rhizophlyctis rosea]
MDLKSFFICVLAAAAPVVKAQLATLYNTAHYDGTLIHPTNFAPFDIPSSSFESLTVPSNTRMLGYQSRNATGKVTVAFYDSLSSVTDDHAHPTAPPKTKPATTVSEAQALANVLPVAQTSQRAIHAIADSGVQTARNVNATVEGSVTPTDRVLVLPALSPTPLSPTVNVPLVRIGGISWGMIVLHAGQDAQNAKTEPADASNASQNLVCHGCVSGLYLTSSGKCVKTCPDRTYKAANGTCTACDPTCSTCTGPSGTQCKTCTSPTQLAINGTCTSTTTSPTCPSGTYKNATTCTPCFPDCADCTGPSYTQCTKCANPFHVLDGTTCFVACRKGFYPSTNGTCTACDASCASCSGAGPSQCLSCSDASAHVEGGTCTQTCPTGTAWNSTASYCQATPSSSQPVTQIIKQWWYIPGLVIAFLLLTLWGCVYAWRHIASKKRKAETQENLERWDDRECAVRVRGVLDELDEMRDVRIARPDGVLVASTTRPPALPPRPQGSGAEKVGKEKEKWEEEGWESGVEGDLPPYEPGTYGMMYRGDEKEKDKKGLGGEGGWEEVDIKSVPTISQENEEATRPPRAVTRGNHNNPFAVEACSGGGSSIRNNTNPFAVMEGRSSGNMTGGGEGSSSWFV